MIVDYKIHYIWIGNYITDAMQNSISILIQQIRAAAFLKKPETRVSLNNQGANVKVGLTDEDESATFESVMGLRYSQFLSADEMSDDEMIAVIAALDETFAVYDYFVEVPERVPLPLKYELYRDLFSGVHVLTPGYTCHFDFCSGYCPGCKVAEFCESRITDGWE